jgi:hypothetical protein
MAARLLVLLMGFLGACKSTGNRPMAVSAKPTRTAITSAPKKAIVTASTTTPQAKPKFKLFSKPLFGRREIQPLTKVQPKVKTQPKPKTIIAERPKKPAPIITRIFPAPPVEIPSSPSVQDSEIATPASPEVVNVGRSLFPEPPVLQQVYPEDMLPRIDLPLRPIVSEPEDMSENEEGGLALLTPPPEHPEQQPESVSSVEVAESIPAKVVEDKVKDEEVKSLKEVVTAKEPDADLSAGKLLLPPDTVPTISIGKATEPIRATLKSCVVTAELMVDNMPVSDAPVLVSTLHVRTLNYLNERIGVRVWKKGTIAREFDEVVTTLALDDPRASTPAPDSFDMHYVYDIRVPVESLSEKYVVEVAVGRLIEGMTLHIEKPGEKIDMFQYRLTLNAAGEILSISKALLERAKDPAQVAKNILGQDHAADAIEYGDIEVEPIVATNSGGREIFTGLSLPNIDQKKLQIVIPVILGVVCLLLVSIMCPGGMFTPNPIGHSHGRPLCGWDTESTEESIQVIPPKKVRGPGKETRMFFIRKDVINQMRRREPRPACGAVPRHQPPLPESNDSAPKPPDPPRVPLREPADPPGYRNPPTHRPM